MQTLYRSLLILGTSAALSLLSVRHGVRAPEEVAANTPAFVLAQFGTRHPFELGALLFCTFAATAHLYARYLPSTPARRGRAGIATRDLRRAPLP